MAIVTSQQLTHYYDYYRTTEIIFTKDIIKVLSMDPRQIYVKCTGSQWPCILNSTSFQAARIIVGTKGDAFKQLAQRDAPAVNIRYYFRKQDGQEIAFFVAGKVHVNQASLEELTQLNGVGLSIAEEIVAERNENGPFYFPEDLISVRGIGMKKLSLFRNDLSFDDDECEGQ